MTKATTKENVMSYGFKGLESMMTRWKPAERSHLSTNTKPELTGNGMSLWNPQSSPPSDTPPLQGCTSEPSQIVPPAGDQGSQHTRLLSSKLTTKGHVCCSWRFWFSWCPTRKNQMNECIRLGVSLTVFFFLNNLNFTLKPWNAEYPMTDRTANCP